MLPQSRHCNPLVVFSIPKTFIAYKNLFLHGALVSGEDGWVTWSFTACLPYTSPPDIPSHFYLSQHFEHSLASYLERSSQVTSNFQPLTQSLDTLICQITDPRNPACLPPVGHFHFRPIVRNFWPVAYKAHPYFAWTTRQVSDQRLGSVNYFSFIPNSFL